MGCVSKFDEKNKVGVDCRMYMGQRLLTFLCGWKEKQYNPK